MCLYMCLDPLQLQFENTGAAVLCGSLLPPGGYSLEQQHSRLCAVGITGEERLSASCL
ncbi:hypothetical protein I79_005881 [Cricetulus griseus]|uniref:Uncharacterized protein n=1 Tax=Cricetulus griseus TaxID=10029 RepID=G3H6C6_CRIGR|nr:hypothetical protein I79_005881 [Cricetulus griseus]